MKRASPPPSNSSFPPPAKRPLLQNGDGQPRFFSGCSSIKAYEIIRKLGEGTFGYVYFLSFFFWGFGDDDGGGGGGGGD